MTKIAIVACVALTAVLGACKKRPPSQAPTPAGPELSRSPIPPPPPPPPGLASPDVQELLTAEKLKRFVTYLQQMAVTTAAQEEDTAKVATAGQAALEKSGLTQDEVARLSRLVMPYYARLAGLKDATKRAEEARARMAEAKAGGREPSPVDQALAKADGEQDQRLEVLRKEFASRYGEERVALLAQHEPDFLPLHEKVTGAALSAMGMRRPPPPPRPGQPRPAPDAAAPAATCGAAAPSAPAAPPR